MDFAVKQLKFDRLMDEKEILLDWKTKQKKSAIKNIILMFTLLPLSFGVLGLVNLTQLVGVAKILFTIIPSVTLFCTSLYCAQVSVKATNEVIKTIKKIEDKEIEIEELINKPVDFIINKKMDIVKPKDKISELKEFKVNLLENSDEQYKKPYIKK